MADEDPSPPAPEPPAKSDGWSLTESRVAFATIIIGTIGLIISAVSSVFSWQQIVMISKERKTPYRAILYSSKVAAYGEIVGANTKFAREFDLPSLTVFTDKGKVEFLNYKSRSKAMDADQIDRAYEELQVSLSKNMVVWNNTIIDDLNNVRKAAYLIALCSQFGSNEQTYSDVGCNASNPSPTEKFLAARLVAERDMKGDIRAEEFQEP